MQGVSNVQDSPFIILTWWVYFASDRDGGEEQLQGELVCVCVGGGAHQFKNETDGQTRCEGVHVSPSVYVAGCVIGSDLPPFLPHS